MKALCDASGVDCRYIHANAKASNPSHQWNQVKVGGKWYILDAQSNGFLLGTNTWIKQAGMSWDTKGLQPVVKQIIRDKDFLFVFGCYVIYIKKSRI